MSKHLTGSKRLAIIQRWINGHDDPDWEVLPTRKEGKYIVKKRTEPIETRENSENEKVEETPEEEKVEETPTKQKPIKVAKVVKPPKTQNNNQGYDPTINLEILNQLKLLGEEIKHKREKKEQKKMIKEVVQKQITKPKNYFPQEFMYQQKPNFIPQEPEPEPKPQPQQLPPQPITFQRRNRIFDDIY